MADIYDIFSKKKVTKLPTKPATYYERNKQCLINIQTAGVCNCDVCQDKKRLARKLFDLVRYLCKDHKDKTGKDLYVADALEIVLMVASRLKIEILK